MKIYMFDEVTKEYLGEEDALIDPLETQKQGKPIYLLAANATFERPPAAKPGYARIFADGWQYVDDNRGKTAVNAERGIFEVDYPGEKGGDTIVTDEMQKGLDNGDFIVDEGKVIAKSECLKAAEKREERNMLIAATDKFMFADYPIAEDERERYRQYRKYLRDIPEAKGFPDENIMTFAEWKGA